jgi:hypothetical protein
MPRDGMNLLVKLGEAAFLEREGAGFRFQVSGSEGFVFLATWDLQLVTATYILL